MNISEGMAVIAEEAERQGFTVHQTRTGAWHVRKGGANWLFQPKDITGLFDVLAILIAAGLDWSDRWD